MKSIINSRSINSFEYGWSSIKLLINNTMTLSATSINYSESCEMSNLYGLGNKGRYRGVGNYTYEGSVTLRKSDLVALQNSAYNEFSTDGSLSGILPFPVIVSYSRADGSGYTTDKLTDVQFLNNGVSSNQGDMDINTDISLIIGNIIWGR